MFWPTLKVCPCSISIKVAWSLTRVQSEVQASLLGVSCFVDCRKDKARVVREPYHVSPVRSNACQCNVDSSIVRSECSC